MKVAELIQLFQGAHILMSNKCKRFFFLTELAPFLPWRSTTWWLELCLGLQNPFCPHEFPSCVHSHNWCDSNDSETHHKTSEGCHMYFHHTMSSFFSNPPPPPPPPHSHNHGCPLYAQATLWSLWHVVDHRWLIFTMSLCSSSLWDLRGTDHVSFIVVSPSMHTVFNT